MRAFARKTAYRSALAVAAAFLAAGVALFALNAAGDLFPPGLPDGVPAREPAPRAQADTLMNAPLERRENESPEAYSRRLALSLHYRVAHGWRGDDSGVALRENWYLWAKGVAGASYAKPIEFAEHEHGIDRGYGICSQFALIVNDILIDQGYESDLLSLDGHVVATATFEDGQERIVDGDYGITIPASLRRIEQDPALVARYYERIPGPASPPYAEDPWTPAQLARFMKKTYAGPNERFLSADHYAPAAAWVERDAYRKKWLIPQALVIVGAALAVCVVAVPRLLRRVRARRTRATA